MPEEWLEGRKEKRRLAPHAAKISEKRDAGESITKEEEDLFNRRHTLVPYIKTLKL